MITSLNRGQKWSAEGNLLVGSRVGLPPWTDGKNSHPLLPWLLFSNSKLRHLNYRNLSKTQVLQSVPEPVQWPPRG